jgi:glycyl-tRNA synthetase beta chain
MGELLLELLSEEIPAWMQQRAVEDLAGHLDEWLQTHRLPATAITRYVTPRRMTVIADGIPRRQPDFDDPRRGPRLGSPRQAIEGFLRSAGLSSVDQCEVREDRYFAVIKRPGGDAAKVLPDAIGAALTSMSWPKSMRFPAANFRWVRPLISVICLFDGEIVPLELDAIPVGRTTRGHRFLSEGEILVDNSADYRDRLEAAYVILDHGRRRSLIAADLDRLAVVEGLAVKPDPGLLDEVTGLVEFPVVLMGRIDDASMALPPEVLATAMRTHQKYFSCLNSDGTPAPRFLFVANNLTPDGGKTIIAGNERVLRARLEDARFFWDQDRKVPLESRVEALKDRVFHAKLGTLHDKIERMKRLAPFLVPFIIPYAEEGKVQRALRAVILTKADLSTGMVGEFPELQGVMGRYYALHDCEDERVADAIADHYKPLGPNDTCPTAPYSVIAALADKLITLVGFFGVGELPTGSRDPFGLRRAALGVIRLILENRLHLPLGGAFEQARAAWGRNWRDVTAELLIFTADRLKVHLRESGVRHDLIAAAFAQVGGAGAEDDLLRLLERVKALQALLATEYGADLLIAYRRASSIVSIEERRDCRPYDGEVDRLILTQPEETALAIQIDNVSRRIETLLSKEAFMGAMEELASLRDPVDDFFDKVTVNCDDAALRENRLRLLSRIRATLNQVADFSQIEG